MLGLLVDTHNDTRALYAEFLRLAAWQIEEASDGREALAKALARRPHAIVTESQLPGINGVDLCRLVRADPSMAATRLVVVTADARPADIDRARSAGADAVLVKPCLPEELARTLEALLDSSRETIRRSQDSMREINDQVARARRELADARELLRNPGRRRGDELLGRPVAAQSCPKCLARLRFVRSYTGGVVHAERWDYFECPSGCGAFEYRLRTRRLKPA